MALPLPAGRGTGWRGLLTAEFGRALVEEGVHAFAEVAAHVAHQDQVLAFAWRKLRAEAAECFFRRLQRERRVSGEECRELARACHESGMVREHFAHEPSRERFRRLDE